MSAMQGTVKWFNDQKGYGFIQSPEIQGDLFVHHSSIKMNGFRTLVEGAKVKFEVAEDEKGKKAVNVTTV